MGKKKRQCKLFYCDRLQERYCCADCGYQSCRGPRCKNPCLNDPEKCGQVEGNTGEERCQSGSSNR